MSEKFPIPSSEEKPSQFPAAQEQAPVSYEDVVEAARTLKASRVKDPFDGSGAALEVQTLLRRYEDQEHLSLDHMSSEEEIEKLCSLACVWLDAGYTTGRFRTAALEVLGKILVTATREQGEESQVVSDITQRIYDVERGPGSPYALKEKRTERYVASGMRDAEAFAAAGKLPEAVQLLDTIDSNEDTRELRLIVRENLHALRTTYKTKLETPNLKQELFTKIEADVRQYIEATYVQPTQADVRQEYLNALASQDPEQLRSLHATMNDAANRTIERKTPEFKTFQYLIHYLGQWLKAV